MQTKEEKKERDKKYYQENKEHVLKQVKKYQQDNKENLKKKRREYYQENKEHCRLYNKKYRRENKEKIREEKKKYHEKPKNKIKRNLRQKNRIVQDKNFSIRGRLRNILNKALRRYTKTGKIMSVSKYGINYKAIIEYLKPFPEDISKYHVDHIKPLCSFDLEDPEEIKKAFAPENHQWLTIQENLVKGGRYE